MGSTVQTQVTGLKGQVIITQKTALKYAPSGWTSLLLSTYVQDSVFANGVTR